MLDFNDLIGKPYTSQHDCAWLCATVTHRLGTHFPEVSHPASDLERAALFQDCIAKYGVKVSPAHPGCIAIFRFPPDEQNPKERWHCNVVIDQGVMLATKRGLGVHSVEMRDDDPTWRTWRLYFQGFYEVVL